MFASRDDTHALGERDTRNLGKTRRRKPCTMLAFGVGTSFVKDVEEHHIESHRVHRGKARVIEDTTHDIEASPGMERSPDMPERLQSVLRREHLQQGTYDRHIIGPRHRGMDHISSDHLDTVCGTGFRQLLLVTDRSTLYPTTRTS